MSGPEPKVLSRVARVAAIGYVALFVLESFPTGVGEHFYGSALLLKWSPGRLLTRE